MTGSVSEAERAPVSHQTRRTADGKGKPSNVIGQIKSTFERQAGRTFLIDTLGGREITYGEFYSLAIRAAGLLHAHGVGPCDRVALVLTNSAEFAALYFGCLFLGAVAVPVNPGLHQREVDTILEHSGAKLVVYSPSTRRIAVPSSPRTCPTLCLVPLHERSRASDAPEAKPLDEIPAPDIPGWQPLKGVGDDDLFSITFTSGTTGMPKGVAHRIASLFENAASFNQELGWGADNRFLHAMPMSYMAGFLNSLLCPFMAGASIVLAPAFDAQSALRFWTPVTQHGADTFWLAPTMLAVLLKIDRDSAGLEYCRTKVKTICVATAPLPLRIKKDFEAKYGVELFESYGLSELLLLTANSAGFARLDGSVGRLLPMIETNIVDDQNRPVGMGVDGEIWIRTPHALAGYWNRQTRQPEPVGVGGWFPTGDVGHLSEDGHLFITARKKDLIIRGGFNISPRAVEDVLMEHQAVDQVAVIGLPDEFYGEQVVAVVKLKPGHEFDRALGTMRALCKEHLSSHAVPTRFIPVEEIPTSANGKVQKNQLRDKIMKSLLDDL